MDNVNLNGYVHYYEDTSGRMNLDGIRILRPDQFIELTLHVKNFGYSDSTFWFKINVINRGESPIEWLLESRYPLIDHITLYTPSEFGFLEIESGDMLPFRTMPMNHYNFTSRIVSKPGNSTIYLKIKSQGHVVIKLFAWDFDSFLNKITTENSLIWLIYGVIIALLAYNTFIFIISRDRIYLYLTLFIFTSSIYTLIHNGIARKFFWPDIIWWGNYSHPLFLIASSLFSIKFIQTFLEIRKNTKLLNVFINGAIILGIPLFFISIVTPYRLSTQISQLILILNAAVIIIFSPVAIIRSDRKHTRYYLIPWFILTMSLLLYPAQKSGLLTEGVLIDWGNEIAVVISHIVLSIVVAENLGRLKQENEKVLSTLKESEERYRLFFDTAHDGIMYCINDIPVYANRNMLTMTELPSDEFYNKNIYEFFSSAGEQVNIAETLSRISSGEIQNTQFEARLIRNEATMLSVLVSISFLASGPNRGMFIIVSDISSLKEASDTIKSQYKEIENQLTELETLNNELLIAQNKLISANFEIEKEKEYLSATLLSIGDGVITYDTDGRIFLMNSVAEELTGFDRNKAIGMHVKDVIRLTDEISQKLFFETLGIPSKNYSFRNIGVPFKILDGNGNEKVVEVNSAIITLENEPFGIVLAIRDITIKNKIDTELVKISKLESIGVLAGGIAHDFNNLLTGISGNISMLKNYGNFPEIVIETFHDVEKAVDRASALTKQLLTFSKGGEPHLIPSSLKDILNESAKFIIKSHDIKYNIRIEEDLKPVMIDPNQISQAINNLLINSVQALKTDGEITIEAGNLKNPPAELPIAPDEYVMLIISDNGPGIPKKNLSKIFDPFFTTKTKGSGLGLTSTYSIISKHKGFIDVSSEENSGTTFRIYLKSTDLPVNNTVVEKSIISTRSEGSILIMDDEFYILDVLVKMLKHQGYKVDCAKNGEEAIELYREKFQNGIPYMLVILDLTVYGGMGGKETIAELLEIDPGIKAIVSSGYSDSKIMANYRDYGFYGILKKPYTFEDLLKAINAG